MARAITLPAVNNARRNEVLFDDESFFALVREYMGIEALWFAKGIIRRYEDRIDQLLETISDLESSSDNDDDTCV